MGQAKQRGTYEQRKAAAIKSKKLSFKDLRARDKAIHSKLLNKLFLRFIRGMT